MVAWVGTKVGDSPPRNSIHIDFTGNRSRELFSSHPAQPYTGVLLLHQFHVLQVSGIYVLQISRIYAGESYHNHLIILVRLFNFYRPDT